MRSRSRSETPSLVANVNKTHLSQKTQVNKRKTEQDVASFPDAKTRRVIVRKSDDGNNNAVPSDDENAEISDKSDDGETSRTEEEFLMSDGIELTVDGSDFPSEIDDDESDDHQDGKESGRISEDEDQIDSVNETTSSASNNLRSQETGDDYQDALLQKLLQKKLQEMSKDDLEQLMKDKGLVSCKQTPVKMIKSPSDTTLYKLAFVMENQINSSVTEMPKRPLRNDLDRFINPTMEGTPDNEIFFRCRTPKASADGQGCSHSPHSPPSLIDRISQFVELIRVEQGEQSQLQPSVVTVPGLEEAQKQADSTILNARNSRLL